LLCLLGKLVYGDNNQLIAEMLGGYMAGVTVSGVLWAVFQNNAVVLGIMPKSLRQEC
jgi:K(+)-stimulated pyrophosphate-energized sodium pump